jgi:uncharacterized CHY-type Zn-finger protein
LLNALPKLLLYTTAHNPDIGGDVVQNVVVAIDRTTSGKYYPCFMCAQQIDSYACYNTWIASEHNLHAQLTTPQDASLWPSHRNTHTYTDDSSNSPPNNQSQHRRPNSHHGPAHHHHQHARSSTSALLASLAHDENTIEQRKLNVRRFGAGWIRPPGIAKTLQAKDDEALEREEQELLQRREQVMMDLAAAQQDAANAEQREQGDAEGDEDQEERDLDEEVPEAPETASEITLSDSEEGSVSADEGAQEDSTVPFNEESFIEGSMLEAEVSHMLEMEEAEMAGVLQDERDLDDDVPEAGSYEHTDSELEDESDGDVVQARGPAEHLLRSLRARREARRSSGRRSSGRRSSGLPSIASGPQLAVHQGMVPEGSANFGASRGVMDFGVDLGHGRSSFGLDGSSSILDGSSFMRSSPAAPVARGSLRDRFLGAVRGGRRG